MKFEYLIAEIEKKQATYFSNQSEEERILREYLKKNSVEKLTDLLHIDIWGFIKCLIYVDSNGSCDMLQSKEKTTAFQSLFDGKCNEDRAAYCSALTISMESKKMGFGDKVIERQISESSFDDKEKENLSTILRFYGEYPSTCEYVVSILVLRLYLDIERSKLLGDDESTLEEKLKSTDAKTYRKNNELILRLQKSIAEFIKTNYERIAQQNKKHYARYTKLLEDLYEKKQSNQYIPVADARTIIKGKLSDTIKLMVLNWIDEYNTPYIEELQSQVDQVKANQKEASNKTDNYILSKLGYLKIEEKTQQEILQNTTKEIVDAVMWYNSNGYISQAAIADNPSIFYIGDEKLGRMKRQIKEINELGLNPKIFMDAPEYLWDECESFISNLKFLVDYSLQGNLSDCENFSFLLEEKLVEKIDLLIELGYYEHLKENLELLNYSLEAMKGLELLKQINPINSMDELIDALESQSIDALESQSFIKFIINYGELDDYIIDYASFFKNEHPDLGDEALKQIIRGKNIDQPVVCEIGGSIFSLPKIYRRLQKRYDLWEAMFYGKRVTEDEYQEIMKVLVPKTK